MDEQRLAYLLKLVRGKDLRKALQAIAELRAAKASIPPKAKHLDDQRAFQYRVATLALQEGVAGLVNAWATLGHGEWRAVLVEEIAQFAEPAVIDLAIAALEDSAREVRVRAAWMLLFMREPEPTKRKSCMTQSEQRWLSINSALRASVTPAQRARMTRALLAMLADPEPVLALVVELLGYTANRGDAAVIAALEALRGRAGEPHTVSYERVAKADFEWYEKLALEKKGDDPQEMMRITYKPTGLLDAKLLEASLARIGRRDPP